MTAITAPEYDAVVVGGGPVGLLVAYQLARFGNSVCVLEKDEKEVQDAYGRAITLFSRTSELLDQLDVIEPILQQGFACRTSVTYKDGVQQIPGRVWTFMENIKDTVYDFALVLRQRYTEAILREKLASVGAVYHSSMECVDFEIDGSASLDSHAVTSYFVNPKMGTQMVFKSKYLIGADGGRSFVRKKAGIPFDGDTTEDKWIRIDGIVETSMPITRAYGAIESKTHGNVLWAPLDHGATRIGYAYTAEIAAKYPDGVTEEVAVKEAIAAMHPFEVKFKEVHWWTLYSIGQRMARTFCSGKRLFLCGDAAHTHSSGAAQGLNTGIHDAVNLAWKLSLQIRGLSTPQVLETYNSERTSAVTRLINYDKDISLLMTHKWPLWYKGDPSADPHVVLGRIFEEASSFNTGLGISYSENVINQMNPVYYNSSCSKTAESEPGSIVPGSRAPDTELITPCTNLKIRLHRVTRNICKFKIVVFTGTAKLEPAPALKALREYLQRHPHLASHEAIGWITIPGGLSCSSYEALGMDPLGETYYDPSGSAHKRYGVSLERGGVVVIRPDGLVGFRCGIDGEEVRGYFSKVLVGI